MKKHPLLIIIEEALKTKIERLENEQLLQKRFRASGDISEPDTQETTD